jgi:hypothetical protein
MGGHDARWPDGDGPNCTADALIPGEFSLCRCNRSVSRVLDAKLYLHDAVVGMTASTAELLRVCPYTGHGGSELVALR